MVRFVALCLLLLFLPMTAFSAENTFEKPGEEARADASFARGSNQTSTFVDCAAGGSINDAINNSPLRLHVALTVNFKGTCTENVTIARDDVTLEGSDGAVLVGGIRIESGIRVHLRNFTVRDNTFFEGAIEAVSGSIVFLTDIAVENAADRGIRIRDSVAEFFGNITVTDSGTIGILNRGARLSFEADMNISNSGQFDIIMTDGTSCFSKDGNITTTGSPAGLVIQNTSSFEGVFGSVNTSGHQLAGILISTQGTFVYSSDIDANNNGVVGIVVDESSSFSPFDNVTNQAELTVTGNPVVGIAVQNSSTLFLNGAVDISGNGRGLIVDIAQLFSTDAQVTGNTAADLDLRFGSTATFNGGNLYDTLLCDATVLTRGEITCPAP